MSKKNKLKGYAHIDAKRMHEQSMAATTEAQRDYYAAKAKLRHQWAARPIGGVRGG